MTLLTPHSGDEHDIREATAELLDYEPGALRKHLFKMHELHSAYARRDLFKRTDTVGEPISILRPTCLHAMFQAPLGSKKP
jgi:hypothetical protein